MVEPQRAQMAIWWRVACWISKAPRMQAHACTHAHTHAHALATHPHTPTHTHARAHTGTFNTYYYSTETVFFVNALQCYVIRTLPVLFALCSVYLLLLFIVYYYYLLQLGFHPVAVVLH